MRIGIFSVIPWHYLKHRPQQFALELARRGHEIFYFEPVHTNYFTYRPLRLLTNLQRAHRKRVVNKNLHLLEPVFIPAHLAFKSRLWLNRFLGRFVLRQLDQLKIDFLIVHEAEYADIILASGIPFSYDQMDATEHFPHVVTDRFQKNLEKLRRHQSFEIRPYPPGPGQTWKYIPNGVDCSDFFPIPCDKVFDGIVVSVFSSWFDWESILACSKNILLVGPMDEVGKKMLERHRGQKNGRLHWIPQLPPAFLNNWINMARVGLVPFKEDDPVARWAVPIKIYEYFRCNVPVVSFENPLLKAVFGDLLVYYSPKRRRSLEAAIEEAQTRVFDYSTWAAHFCWDEVVGELDSLIRREIGNN